MRLWCDAVPPGSFPFSRGWYGAGPVGGIDPPAVMREAERNRFAAAPASDDPDELPGAAWAWPLEYLDLLVWHGR